MSSVDKARPASQPGSTRRGCPNRLLQHHRDRQLPSPDPKRQVATGLFSAPPIPFEQDFASFLLRFTDLTSLRRSFTTHDLFLSSCPQQSVNAVYLRFFQLWVSLVTAFSSLHQLRTPPPRENRGIAQRTTFDHVFFARGQVFFSFCLHQYALHNIRQPALGLLSAAAALISPRQFAIHQSLRDCISQRYFTRS